MYNVTCSQMNSVEPFIQHQLLAGQSIFFIFCFRRVEVEKWKNELYFILPTNIFKFKTFGNNNRVYSFVSNCGGYEKKKNCICKVVLISPRANRGEGFTSMEQVLLHHTKFTRRLDTEHEHSFTWTWLLIWLKSSLLILT